MLAWVAQVTPDHLFSRTCFLWCPH